MKHLIMFCLMFSLFFVACEEECHVDNPPAACSDTIPDEFCAVAFNQWFYNESTNTCEQIGYSGCSKVGFDTELECQDCVCLSE